MTMMFNHVPILREKFISCLYSLLLRDSFIDSSYSGHSFEIRAAAAASIKDHVIKELGRWCSDIVEEIGRNLKESSKQIQHAWLN
jgi:hypothetical protein